MNNIQPMNRTHKHIILLALLLLMGNAVVAQNDALYVIKVRQSNHYLAHVKVGDDYVIQDATDFSPSCLWYSGIEHNITGTNHNYYFIDDHGNLRFLAASMGPNKSLRLSDDLPPTYLLSNTDTLYYFYDWDAENNEYEGGGVARGHQYTGITDPHDCTHSWGIGECWEVYWLVYSAEGGWRTSADTYYGIDSIPYVNHHSPGGRYHKVTAVQHPKEITGYSPSMAAFVPWTPAAVNSYQTFSATAQTCNITYKPTYYEYSFSELHVNLDGDYHYHDTLSVPDAFGPYYFCGNTATTASGPAPVTSEGCNPVSYEWTITGAGAQFLSFASGTSVLSKTGTISGSSQTLSETVYYIDENNTGTKTATLKLVVTYDDHSTQECTAVITLETSCQNPSQAAEPVVNYDNVTVSWYHIAHHYELYYRKAKDIYSWDTIRVDHPVGPITSCTIVRGLESDTVYQYKVKAFCSPIGPGCEDPTLVYTFRTKAKPELLIQGSVFGGGRMADVNGRTEVVVVNCDSIGAVYGGNDIAGTVRDSSIVVVGVTTPGSYGSTEARIRIGDVYGGGNGYYAYNGTAFVPATTPTVDIPASASVVALSPSGLWDDPVWTNPKATGDSTLTLPSISKTSVTVANDYVKIDSLFGGAKNAFLTYDVANRCGDSVVIKGGTILAVFGGNNMGGSQGAAKQYVEVSQTTVNLQDSIINTPTTGFGRDFGIRYLFGGGNKVTASTTDVVITGGQLDTIFAGGNSADVATAANITVNCVLGAKTSDYTFGKVYTNAIDPDHYTTGTIDDNTIDDDYRWNGISGIYNVRALFGGNNQDTMRTAVPTITLTSGSVGTVYGGGNAGDMNGYRNDPGRIADDFGPLVFFNETGNADNDTIVRRYSTHVKMDQPNMLVDFVYGGCQISNVFYSSWVEISQGHVGTVYGGCNISGDVGSTYLLHPTLGDYGSYLPLGTEGPWKLGPRHEKYQAVMGATFVKVSGGKVYNDVFAGSNGRYHCNDGKVYVEGIDFDNLDAEGRYLGESIPSHNETHVYVSGTAEIGGSVYAGGNLASVGFINETAPTRNYPRFVGMASVCIAGGNVHGNVFGGGNMASIWGSNSVKVEGGTIGGALYGGNDRIGLVAQITNRVLPPEYGMASDGHTSLADVRTYISLTGRPEVNTVYGGGNGAYDDYETGQYCNSNDQPVQANTFVDINIDGFEDPSTHALGGYINTVYGGGNGVTVTGTTTVFLNVKGFEDGEPAAYDHVGTIFGGNNLGPLAILPDIILLKGQVNTVYGGCNQGAMIGNHTVDTYEHVGSLVRLRDTYTAGGTTIVPTAKVSNAVYGGCRMNGVDNGSLVLVEGGTFGDTVNFFGGSDISGAIGGISRVVVKNGSLNPTVIGNAFGGGNGHYDYDGHNVYVAGSGHTENDLIATSDAAITRPSCESTRVDMVSGTAGNLYGGGNAAGVTNTAVVNMNGGRVTSGLYGGCCSMDTIHGAVTVNVLGGIVGTNATTRADIFGGGYGQLTRTTDNVTVNIQMNAATDTIFGDVYGGSALGHVNDSLHPGTDNTIVNILDGVIYGDVYGGGLGDSLTGAEVKAYVHGKTYVNIGTDTNTGNIAFRTYVKDAKTLGANVYGCNNLNGSPMDSVFVNIYKTAHIHTTPGYDTCPDINSLAALQVNAGTQRYAIQAVYGGGNLAAYTPSLTATGEPKSATVHVYSCQNTVKDVYGGGNAADVGTTAPDAIKANTFVIIDGGRFQRIFNGGNGAVSPANIYGTATADIRSGLADQVFGGGNMRGAIDSTSLLLSHVDAGCANSNEVFSEVFGGGNQAAFSGNLNSTVGCSVGTIGAIYGGSNLANVTGDVALTIKGGSFDDVFGGSKGYRDANPANNDTANIVGNVTLNLEGGTIRQAFGGSNILGNITGKITVNVLDTAACSVLNLDTVYGSGNLTYYSPTDPELLSPVVNIINGVVNKAVFGGGKGVTAVVTANPVVTVCDTLAIGYAVKVRGNVYGGGNAAIVEGNTLVNIRGQHNTDTIFNIFGGGNEAGVTGNATINMLSGKVTTGIYGGCNTEGNIAGNINVTIKGGVLGVSSSDVVNIFGGGYGGVETGSPGTTTDGHVTVTIDTAANGVAPTIYGNIYGGSAFGEVGDTDKLTKVDLKYGNVHGKIFGGGMGDGSHDALVSGDVEVAIAGNVTDSIFGGCNVHGRVTGDIAVNLMNDLGATGVGGYDVNVFGGGLGHNTHSDGNVTVTVGDGTNNPTIYGTIYGGSAMGYVNSGNDDVTKVWLKSGTVNGRLYGGGLGQKDDPATGENESVIAEVNGGVQVLVDGGSVTRAVYGCNDKNGAPLDTVNITINGGTVANVVGGGNLAAYEAPPENRDYPAIYITGGEVTHKVIGGGNAANIEGNPVINIKGGNICTEPTGVDAGVYGGCNETGVVDGDITINITGSTTVIGTVAALEAQKPINVHGGGYGAGTGTTGDVTVNFGVDTNGTPSEFPKLNGDLYGGSALGTVNTNVANATTVNVLNGSFGYREYMIGGYPVQFGGNIYGGGLGDADGGHPAKVMGVVHVNIGAPKPDPTDPTSAPLGQASLVHCNVYGCNNAYGSPQENVFVDVYQTAHTPYNVYSYTQTAGQPAEEYAIQNVFGGGNKAHYAPDTNPGDAKKPRVYIHYCENTSEYVYGGGNAADVNTTDVTVEGGRYKFVFGGGNGQVSAANVGDAGVYLTILGGRIGWAFGGCNMHGQVAHNSPSAIHMTTGCTTGDCPCEDQHVVIENYYFGANMATVYGGLTGSDQIVNCGDNFEYKNVYAGSRLATVYGDIELTVNGGHIGNLFGGCEGSQYIEASVKKYPEDWQTNSAAYDQELIDFLQEKLDNEGINLAGKGGNITLHLHGGTIGNVFGGCDFRGNVEGVITIIVDSLNQSLTDCRLDIDYVYGGNRLATYKPLDSLNIVSPIIRIQNGHVNGAVFGGSMGGDPTHQFGNGRIVCNPKVEIGDNNPSHSVRIGGMLHSAVTPTLGEGAVFGGGNAGEVKGNTQVILQGNSTIEGNVFGGGKQADVEGSTHVTIVPNNP